MISWGGLGRFFGDKILISTNYRGKLFNFAIRSRICFFFCFRVNTSVNLFKFEGKKYLFFPPSGSNYLYLWKWGSKYLFSKSSYPTLQNQMVAPQRQMNCNLVAMVYRRSSTNLPFFFCWPDFKHGWHGQYLFLIGQN